MEYKYANKISAAADLVLREHSDKHLPTAEWNEAKDKAIAALQKLWELNRDGLDVRK